jgi:hypothetical protein
VTSGGRTWERTYPWVLGGAVAAAVVIAHPAIAPRALEQLAGTSVSVAAIIIGFIATMMTLLVALGETRSIKFLREAGRYDELLLYLRTPMEAAFVLAAVSLLFSVLSTETRWVIACWGGTVVLTGGSVYRLVQVIFHVMNPR